MRNHMEIPLWKEVPLQKWTDWHWQFQHAMETESDLDEVVNLSDEERDGIRLATQHLKMRISPHIATLMYPDDPEDPIRKQFIPSAKELLSLEDSNLFADVNADNNYSPVYGLIHRYPTKVLVFPSNYCGTYCRYCFRRKLSRDIENTLSKNQLNTVIDYISKNPNIEEVILSGGEPLVLSDNALGWILDSLKKIPHVQLIRIHTRLPVTIPYRITSNLVSVLKKYYPIFIVIHVDTPREITEPMKNAVAQLVDNGIPCFASTPLLKGINDDEKTLRSLWLELLKIRVKPYYLFHSDPVKGLRHFMVPLERGIEIIRNLYDQMSGLAMPHYCFNVPNGGGHVLINHNYLHKISAGRYLITTFDGKQFEYNEEPDYASSN